jgi:hypothetical protein
MKPKLRFLFLVLVCLLIILACNITNTSTTPSSSLQEITSTAFIEKTSTSILPTDTPRNTLTPTITFTPMAIQFLGKTQALNFTEPLPLSAPNADPMSITGIIYNGYGLLKDAYVEISKTYCGETFQRVKTDEQGRYLLTNIEAGVYYLDFHKQGVISFCGEEITKGSTGLAKDIIYPQDVAIITFPRDKQQITETKPTIEWKAVSGASFYVIELTYQTSGEPGWGQNWKGAYIGTWVTNQTTFTIPFNLNTKTDYKLNVIAYTAERLPLVWAFEVRFHY